jgi:hypothetical protein
MDFPEHFTHHLVKKSGTLKFSICEAEGTAVIKFGLEYPVQVMRFYSSIRSINITHPREFEMLDPSVFSMPKAHRLVFSRINGREICFDTSKLNPAGQWDILNLETDFLITQTFASYISNKCWAWVERGREIWAPERYDGVEFPDAKLKKQ